jgi:hypothetical protein
MLQYNIILFPIYVATIPAVFLWKFWSSVTLSYLTSTSSGLFAPANMIPVNVGFVLRQSINYTCHPTQRRPTFTSPQTLISNVHSECAWNSRRFILQNHYVPRVILNSALFCVTLLHPLAYNFINWNSNFCWSYYKEIIQHPRTVISIRYIVY